MKKISLVALSFAILVFAANSTLIVANSSERIGQEDNDQDERVEDVYKEDDDLDEINQLEEEESASDSAGRFGANRNTNAREHMSVVAQEVESLLSIPDRQGGIGEEVRLIAQEQQQTQEQLQTQLGQLDDRTGLVRALIGPNFRVMNNIRSHIENNQRRIDQLMALQETALYPAEKEQVDQAIASLEIQNNLLQDQLEEERTKPSAFGWLFRLFSK